MTRKSNFFYSIGCSVPKRNSKKKVDILHSIWLCGGRVEDEAGLVPAAGEDLEPLVEGGLLLLEEDVPFLEQAEAAGFG